MKPRTSRKLRELLEPPQGVKPTVAHPTLPDDIAAAMKRNKPGSSKLRRGL